MLDRWSAAALIGGGAKDREETPEEKQMAGELVRVKVISDFYGAGGKVHKTGEVLEVSPNFARELVATGRAVREEVKSEEEKVVLKDEAAAEKRSKK